jgi:hypothetical protein
MSKLSVTQEHNAEIERLRRIRQAESMLVSVELDQDQVDYLAGICDLDAEQRNDSKIVGAALQTVMQYWLKD